METKARPTADSPERPGIVNTAMVRPLRVMVRQEDFGRSAPPEGVAAWPA